VHKTFKVSYRKRPEQTRHSALNENLVNSPQNIDINNLQLSPGEYEVQFEQDGKTIESRFEVDPINATIVPPTRNQLSQRSHVFTGMGEPNISGKAYVTINGDRKEYDITTTNAGLRTLPIQKLERGPLAVEVVIAGRTARWEGNSEHVHRASPRLDRPNQTVTPAQKSFVISGWMQDPDVRSVRIYDGNTPLQTVPVGA